jgi:polysaccharide pyruvyl transferase WcaK-like protein
MKIGLLDPGIQTQDGQPSFNLGDLIIQAAVNRELASLFPGADVARYSTHSPLTSSQLAGIQSCGLIFVGGTNLLSSRFRPWNRWSERYGVWSNQWSISLFDALRIGRAVLIGAGWRQYQPNPDLFSRIMLRTVLSRIATHSLRDHYSLRMLQAAGIRNALNTSCVTMWPFTDPLLVNRIPREKSRSALVMLTDYAQDAERDSRLLKLINGCYERVYAWPQGSGDLAYFVELGFTGMLLEHSYAALESFVDSEEPFDYIGTRLHGGIRCLLSSRRALILEVDNRAAEIARDTGLPTVRKDDFAGIEQWIDGSEPPAIHVPVVEIEGWRNEMRRRAC